MRKLLFALAPAALMGCAAAGTADPELACRSQGHAPGTEEFRVCMDAGGAAIATGPGSPYVKSNQGEM
ncbi:MAG TPA: hypothetical protein VFJ13_03375 [Paracoccaceae bacterium]|nr:hypothetical protein [Paracoccaceae bacterium]